MRTVFEKLAFSSLRDHVSEQIRDAILSGTLSEGERITERKLADQFATSLTIIREALIELEGDGYVVRKSNRTTHVIAFSADAVEDIFVFRRIVETAAVEEACRSASAEQMRLLETACAQLLDAAQSDDQHFYHQKDLTLHEVIWKISNNECLAIALNRVIRPFFAFTAIRTGFRVLFDVDHDAHGHIEFANAILSRDPLQARSSYLRALDEWHGQARDQLLMRKPAELNVASKG